MITGYCRVNEIHINRVLIDSALKFHKQTAASVKNAISRLGLIRKTFASLGEKTLPLLFKSLVRSKLEYGNLI